MSHGIQMFIAALVMMLPAIVVHFSMVSARKDMNNKMNEKPRDPMRPEEDYGRGVVEADEYEKLKKLSTPLTFLSIVAVIVVLFFTSILPISFT